MTTAEVRHYALQADIARVLQATYPIVALCGYVWIPTRPGEGLPICGECQVAFDQLSALETAKAQEETT